MLPILFLLLPNAAAAQSPARSAYADSDVVIIGELHDNPIHHEQQAALIREIKPSAIVFEMLMPQEAEALSEVPRDILNIQAAMDGFHWSNIADYADLFLATNAEIVGAAQTKADVRASFSQGAAEVFGPDALAYGLEDKLADALLNTRKKLQFEAHCEAMPLEMMGGMVEAQRFRDAAFARTVLTTYQKYGAPVVLIAGNGHARQDWGVPSFIARVDPSLTVVSIGQGEDGTLPLGGFSDVWDAPSLQRPDPCLAFQ